MCVCLFYLYESLRERKRSEAGRGEKENRREEKRVGELERENKRYIIKTSGRVNMRWEVQARKAHSKTA